MSQQSNPKTDESALTDFTRSGKKKKAKDRADNPEVSDFPIGESIIVEYNRYIDKYRSHLLCFVVDAYKAEDHYYAYKYGSVNLYCRIQETDCNDPEKDPVKDYIGHTVRVSTGSRKTFSSNKFHLSPLSVREYQRLKGVDLKV